MIGKGRDGVQIFEYPHSSHMLSVFLYSVFESYKSFDDDMLYELNLVGRALFVLVTSSFSLAHMLLFTTIDCNIDCVVFSDCYTPKQSTVEPPKYTSSTQTNRQDTSYKLP